MALKRTHPRHSEPNSRLGKLIVYTETNKSWEYIPCDERGCPAPCPMDYSNMPDCRSCIQDNHIVWNESLQSLEDLCLD